MTIITQIIIIKKFILMSKESLIIFLISFIIGNIYSQYITLKFRTNIDLNSINEENYMKSAVEQQIYVDFKVGESNQVIPMTLKTMKYPTFIVSSRSLEEDILIKYNETKSPNSFKYLNNEEIKNLFIYDFTQGYYASDSLTFNSSSKYNNFSYILATKMNGVVKNISGEIGFSKKIENKNNYIYPQNTNFLQQLLDNKLIRRKNFGIKYDSQYEGRLIIGTTLNEIDSSYKNENPIKIEIDNNVPNNNKENWLLKFTIQFKKSESEEYTETSYGFLQYELGLIFGSNSYRNNFINNYFQTKGCSENKIESSPYSFYQYTCTEENQFSDFPELKLSYNENYTFTFNKNDLFKKVGNKYFFLIVFQATQMDVNYWRLGQLFFRKYPMFLFEDEEGKPGQILYYTTNKEKKDDDDGKKTDDDGGDPSNTDNEGDEGSNVGLVVSLSILIPLIVIAAVVLGILYYRRRNKRAEVLLKDYPEEGNPILNN